MIVPGPTESSTYLSRLLFRFGVFALASAVMLLPFLFTASGPTTYVWYVLIRAVATISAFGSTVLLVFDWVVQRQLEQRAADRSDDASG